MDSDAVRTIVRDQIQSHAVLTMATCSVAAIPNATPHEYLPADGCIYLEISPQHPSVQNIDENPVVHFVIMDPMVPNQPPSSPYVVQVLADAEILRYSDKKNPENEEFAGIWGQMEERYPFIRQFHKENRAILKFTPIQGDLLRFSQRGLEKFHFTF